MTTTAAKRSKPRKATAPRRAATRTRVLSTNGNGAAAVSEEEPTFEAPLTEEEKQALADGRPPVAVPPQRFEPTPDPVPPAPPTPEAPTHPYGDRQVYTFTPAFGGPPIVFPHISTVRPTYHFLWKIRKMDQVHQSFEWMDLAAVPDDVQERVALLPDDDQARFFLGWFRPSSDPANSLTNGMAGPPGES